MDGPTEKRTAKRKNAKIDNIKLVLKERIFFRESIPGKYFSIKSFVILIPKYATTMPPNKSVKKCAPTTTRLKETKAAKKIIRYFNRGTKKATTKATTNIVEV